MSETDNEMNGLKAWSKILFALIIIIMPILAWNNYSGWWMIGYIIIALGSVQGLLGSRLPLEYGVGLLLADIALITITVIGLWSTSIWIPIIQTTIGIMAGGSLHNLWEEQQKRNSPEPETEEEPETIQTISEADQYDLDHLISVVTSAAKNNNVELINKVLEEDPKNQRLLPPFTQQLEQRCDNGDAEALYVYGFLLYMQAQKEGNSNNIKLVGQILGPAIAMIAQSAKKEYRPAMKFIAHNYQLYHSGNLSRQEKEILNAILELAAEFCSPEYCYQQCKSFIM